MRSRLYVIVPVLNEAGNVERLVDSFRAISAQLSGLDCLFIMVDDGSIDGTADHARAHAQGLAFEVLRHDDNRGPGCAFATGFASLQGRLSPDDWVTTLEGDNTSRVELLNQMLTRAQEGFDVVLASPYLYGGGIVNTSTLRTALSHVANLFVKEVLGIHGIMTMSSFFRLYRGKTILRLQQLFGAGILERSGFESMVELLLKLVKLRTSISEVAMVLDSSRRAGKSKMHVVGTGLRYLTLWRDKGRWGRLVDGEASKS